ncbi:MAG: hypothetical protein JXB13_19370 [Phycisphaerae bacterium]|nr:hypothetical protein [Phycisphaerae bacterium]
MADESKDTGTKVEEGSEGVASGSSAARKKEPPAFAWKLTGYADGLTLTLLKCVERKDAEAQLVRLEKEGYYTGLLITALTDPVPPGPTVKKKWEPAPARVFEDDSRTRAARARPASSRPVGKSAATADKSAARTTKQAALKKIATGKSKAPPARKAPGKAASAAKAAKAAKAAAKTKTAAAKSTAKAPKTKKPKAIRKKK